VKKNKKSTKPFQVSVIIPTYNRSKILKRCLGLFFKQDYPKNKTEVVVIDDGSIDDTKRVIDKLKEKVPGGFGFKYLIQKKQGPAAARNLGIKKCRGDIVIIVNDDFLPEEDLISQHVKFHHLFPTPKIAVLGYTTWSPEIEITPFMYWLENGGPLFNYSHIKGDEASWWQTWTCNISYKKEFLLKEGLFDEGFPYAAWEDVELGYRLHKKGLRIKYNKEAVGYHYHPTTLISSMNKMKTHGASAVIFGEKVSDKSHLPLLARKDTGLLIDLIDRVFFISPVCYVMERVALFCEPRYIFHHLYKYLLLHNRVLGRRKFLKKGHV